MRTINKSKKTATALLREYDTLKSRLRVLERETQKAVTQYGLDTGTWGLSVDKFRLQLQMEAEREARERANG